MELSFPGIALRTHESKGRHLVATRCFKPGELVMQHKPYASVQTDDCCDHCFSPAPAGLMKCGACKQARYCCRDHQRLSWQAGHSNECRALRALLPNMPPPTVRLAARALVRAHGEITRAQSTYNKAVTHEMHAGSGSQSAREGGSWRDVQGLVHHWEQLDDAHKALYAQMATLTRKLALLILTPSESAALPTKRTADGAMPESSPGSQQGGAEVTLPSVREVALLLARLAANAHTICDEELRPIGSGLYPLASMANHSCDPTAMQSFAGDVMQFRAVRLLSPGDEITIAYVELAATRQERREALFEQYAFDINVLPSAAADDDDDHGVGSGKGSGDTAAAAAAAAGDGSSVQGMGGLSLQETEPGKSDAGCGLKSLDGHVPNQQQQKQQQQQQQQARSTTTLRPPPLAEQSVDLTTGEDCTGPAPSYAADAGIQPSIKLHVYGLGVQPPWPCDSKDTALTEVQLLHCSTPHSSSSTSSLVPGSGACAGGELAGTGLALQGGVQVHALRAQAPQDAAGSFEGFDGADGDAHHGMQNGSTSASSPLSEQHQQQQQRLHKRKLKHNLIEVGLWGPWAAASCNTLCSTAPSPQCPPGIGTIAGGPAAVQHDTAALSQQQQQQHHHHHQQQQNGSAASQPQLDLRSLSMEVAALKALQLHAEHLAEHGSCTQAVMLLTQALARADGFTVRCLPVAGLPGQGPSPNHHSPNHQAAPPATTTAAGTAKLALGPLHGLRITLCSTLLRLAIAEGSSWSIALHAARLLTPAYEQLYPPVWPNFGLHLAQHAKLAMFLEHPREAAQVADRALSILRVTHAGKSMVLDEVARIRWEAQQEVAAKGQEAS